MAESSKHQISLSLDFRDGFAMLNGVQCEIAAAVEAVHRSPQAQEATVGDVGTLSSVDLDAALPQAVRNVVAALLTPNEIMALVDKCEPTADIIAVIQDLGISTGRTVPLPRYQDVLAPQGSTFTPPPPDPARFMMPTQYRLEFLGKEHLDFLLQELTQTRGEMFRLRKLLAAMLYMTVAANVRAVHDAVFVDEEAIDALKKVQALLPVLEDFLKPV